MPRRASENVAPRAASFRDVFHYSNDDEEIVARLGGATNFESR
jgi:hypothetical protein